MKDLHVAIVNQPNPAHVHPTFAIVETLVRRGCRVTYVTSERYAAEIAKLGGEVLLGPRHEFPFNQPRDPNVPISQQYCSDPIDLASLTFDAVWSFYQQHVPDLFLFDSSAFIGLVLAQRLSVPAIRMTPGWTYERENLQHASFTEELRERINRTSSRVDAFFRQHGIDTEGALFVGREPAIHFYLRELSLVQPAPVQDRLYAARCPAERPFLSPWQGRRAKHTKTALISASTVYDQGPEYYRTCMEALSELQLGCLLAVGAGVDVTSFGTLPENCAVVQGVPLISLMPHADIIVCLGGTTTVMEALYHGLPLVMLTHGNAHAEIYADNVEAHGLGVHLKGPQPSAAGIRDCVGRILDDAALNVRVKQAQKRVRNSAGAEEVANWIEQHLDALQRSRAGGVYQMGDAHPRSAVLADGS